ncbi:unnamed protein product [Linum tenue]|uniref:Uncharacterized protein n=1 Tax=Linum tenue TaxID=586396 RepID=A0AAV0IVJ5_9ROSI|nr:unnamed protein product [Linum tenue]
MEDVSEIETRTDSLSASIIFHVIRDVIGFVLYMHQQIPSVLPDLTTEFDDLQAEYKNLEAALSPCEEAKGSFRRKHAGRMRDIKRGIRKLQKLMDTVNSLDTALQIIISEVPGVESAILILGSSPIRPHHVYEFSFTHGNNVATNAGDFTKSKAAEGLARKAIRVLISKGAGSGSYPGPTKLFLLVKAPSSFNSPLHFLPKRDFRYSKKVASLGTLVGICYDSYVVVPFRVRLRCRNLPLALADDASLTSSSSIGLGDFNSHDLIWFQCRHVIKGLTFKIPDKE